MGGHQEGNAFVGCNIEKELKDRGAGLLVERTGGFVCEQDSGVVHERAANGGALAFATGELLDFLVEAVGEAGAVREMLQALIGEGAIGSGGNGGNEAVFLEGEVGDEIVKLEDEADFVAQ